MSSFPLEMLSRSPPLALAAHSRLAHVWTFVWHVLGCDPSRGLSAIAKLLSGRTYFSYVLSWFHQSAVGKLWSLILGSGRKLEVPPPKVQISRGHLGGRTALEAFC